MLYLAELQKQKSGFMGAAKAELKLLACQRVDSSWNPVPREELIPASVEETNNLNDGALVLVDLNPQRQVQRIQEAGRPLVSILQNLSRQVEKFKSQEEEIAQWKQSLTYQSQQLSSRQMEIEARLEQLQQMEENFEQLENQQQEISQAQAEIERVRSEVERNRQELEEAWKQLLGEQRLLEEKKVTGWDSDRTGQIQELVTQLERCVTPGSTARSELEHSFEMVTAQQNILNHHWQELDGQRQSVSVQQEEVDRVAQLLQNHLWEWQQTQNSLDQAKSELQAQTSTLMSKQEQAQMLGQQLLQAQDLYQQIKQQVDKSAAKVDSQIDLSALEGMSLEQLQQIVQTYSSILQKAEQFVGEQEEELRFVQLTISSLQTKLSSAAEHERQYLEMELAEEQDRYQMLNETLVGQRQNLQEREEVLNQHRAVLLRRQGNIASYGSESWKVDVEQILVQLLEHKQQRSQELQELEQQISLQNYNIQQGLLTIAHQSQEQETQRQELQSLEQNLLSLQIAAAESSGRLKLYEEMLQPVQDNLDGLRQRLEALASSLAQAEEISNEQFQTIAKIKQNLESGRD